MNLRIKFLGAGVSIAMLLLCILAVIVVSFNSLNKGFTTIVEKANHGVESSIANTSSMDTVSKKIEGLSAEMDKVSSDIALSNMSIQITARKIKALSENLNELSENVDEIYESLPDGEAKEGIEILADDLMDIQEQTKREALIGLAKSQTDMEQFVSRIKTAVSDLSVAAAELKKGQIISREVSGLNQDMSTQAESFKQVISKKKIGLSAFVLVLCVLSCGGVMFWAETITRPLLKSIKLAETIADKDFTRTVSVDRKDEIGTLAVSLNGIVERIGNVFLQIRGSASSIDTSTNTLKDLSSNLDNATSEMAGQSNNIATAVEEINSNMSSIAAASEETSTNISIVAAAAEEMTVTITEISSQSAEAREITAAGVLEAEKATESVHHLGEAAGKISAVTESINDIADQTNLLALNATIEAARAGEAGKGFAVVANEIKELAKQTTEATREIQGRIEGVQTSTKETVSVMNSIASTINTTSEIVETMSVAVDEQAATSQEIASNISQAAIGVQEVNENIANMTMASGKISYDIRTIKKNADSVSLNSNDITEMAIEMRSHADLLSELITLFSIGDEQFDIGKVKNAHFTWKMKLNSALSGYTELPISAVPDHHQCEFGQWYDNASQQLKELPIYQELGEHHKMVHAKIIEVLNLHSKNDAKSATGKLEEFETVRKKLFSDLDKLYLG